MKVWKTSGIVVIVIGFSQFEMNPDLLELGKPGDGGEEIIRL